MEAASRPSLELLPDLPVEAPLDSSAPRKERPAAAPAGAAAAAAPKPAAPRDPEQTGLNFLDPEMFLEPGAPPAAAPEATPAPPAQDAVAGLELVLEDPVVDDMLTTPPLPAPAAAPVVPAAAAAKKEAAAPSAASETPRSARVPIARTASLSSAADKVAAATERSAPRSDPPKAAPAKPAVTAVPSARAAPAPARSDASPRAASPKATAAEAPSLASWTSARAAASPPVKPPALATKSTPPAAPAKPSTAPSPPVVAAAPAAPAAAAPAKSATAKTPAAATPAAPAPSAAASASAPMDRDFIARNQVVERYLSGRLPLKGATDFERFCAENPQILDEIGLPERVNAGLRLLEASGKPEPWQEAARPVWQKVQVTLGLAAAVALFALTLAFVSLGSASKSHRIAELQKESAERALDPATSTRVIRLVPSRDGASNSPAITIGGIGGSAQLADIRIDESRSPYHAFRVTIDRIDQGRVAILGDLAKDSNGHLRIALNSSALGPGNYQLTLEGLDWRGEPQPDSWVTIGITH
jgi:hypothetical protein